jgi:uncharacterized protein (TIGR03118 family)
MRLLDRSNFVAWGAALLAASLAMSILALCVPASAAPISRGTTLKDYQANYLVSDGSIPSEHLDLEFRNGWGLAASPMGPWWVAVNELEAAKVHDADGAPQPLHVVVPGAPTGIVNSGGDGFIVTDGSASDPALFLLATEGGKIAGWNPSVGPASPQGEAFVGADRSSSGAVYKGLAIAQTSADDRLYAADFHNGRIDVFDESFALVTPLGAFVDPKLPAGYAPFGVQTLAGHVFVSYAKQDADALDEIAGQGLGAVAVFDTDGQFVDQVAVHGQLNAPWGMAIAPAGFGAMSGKLLVGNFGDGTIVAYTMTDDMKKFTPSGTLRDASRKPLQIDGLWGLAFGNDGGAGAASALYFAAGPSDESHGSFGRVTVVSTP